MSAKDRRAIVLGAAVLLPGFLFVWGVRPYRAALSDARDQLASERETLARERAAVATAQRNPQLQHVADSAMRTMTPRLFEGKDDVMASSELASYIGDVARTSRVWLEDAGTRPATPAANGVRTLRVEIRAESDLRGTLTFLRSLESGAKLVRIDRLDISRAPRASESDDETLSIAATISGFAIGSASPVTAPRPATTAPARAATPSAFP
ncbi:MAG TPA: type II secretion system protein GspM [Gemmatimonadaceae bacterium]